MNATIIAAIIAAVVAFGKMWWDKYLEKQTIYKALLADIQRLLDILRDHEEWWSSCVSTGSTDHPLIPFSTDV